MTRLYVVLHHTFPHGGGEAHFDLLLAEGDDGPLRTWRSSAWPLAEGAALSPLPPHRRAYLTYEGPVSGNRGEVRRAVAGEWTLLDDAGDGPVVRFDEGPEAWQLGTVARRRPYACGRDAPVG